MPKPLPESSVPASKSSRRELLQESILEAASTLFIQRGFQGTSMGDIAEAMGVTRTAIYYYFRNKEAILRELTTEVTGMAGKLASQVEDPHDDPIEALRQLVLQHAKLILSHPLQFRVVERNEENLSPALRKSADASRRLVLNRFQTVIEAGIKAGQFRVVDPKIAAFAIIGMCNWCAWWFSAEGKVPLNDVAQMLATFALQSVVRGEERRSRENSVDESLRQLREDLSLLEKRLQNT
ncbi:TetR family transcriptional regulator OS=Eoetvoesiella caeni OX=645616 GN=DFR37_10230 PE=4 SV=1 [Eoetvoesiella caeni]